MKNLKKLSREEMKTLNGGAICVDCVYISGVGHSSTSNCKCPTKPPIL